MLDRSELKLNSLLAPKFFEYNEEAVNKFFTPVNFPLPESPEHLEDFLKSAEGEQFKKSFAALIDKLIDWSVENGLNVGPLKGFRGTHINYSGSNIELNKVNLPLYHHGTLAFSSIINCLNSKLLPHDFCVDQINELITHIDVCAPGSYTHYVNSALKMTSRLDLSVTLIEIKKSIAEQFVLTLLQPYNIPQSLEIHYVNGVLKKFSGMLGIPQLEDHYIESLCNKEILEKLYEQFRSGLARVMNPENVIDTLISTKLGPDLLVTKLNECLKKSAEAKKKNEKDEANLTYARLVSEFEDALAFFGTESTKQFFRIDHIIESDDFVTCSLNHKAKDILFLSLFERLLQGNIFCIPNDMQKRQTMRLENYTFNYLSSQSLKFAYLHKENPRPPESRYQPFLSYCKDVLFSRERVDILRKRGIIALADNYLSDVQRLEIVQIIIARADIDASQSIDAEDKENKFEYYRNIMMPFLSGRLGQRFSKFSTKHLLDVMHALDPQEIENDAEIMCLAARFGEVDAIADLINNGADVNKNEISGLTPLSSAIAADQYEIMQQLVEIFHADIHQSAAIDGSTPLHIAARGENLRAIEYLLSHGSDINSLNFFGDTALYLAAADGKLESVKILVKNADIQMVDRNGDTALHAAASEGHEDIVEVLLSQDSVNEASIINEVNIYGSTALHLAVINGYTKVIRSLIKAKANLEMADEEECTPLYLAASIGNAVIVAELVSAGVDVDIPNADGVTPLIVATNKGNHDVVKELLVRGNVDHADNHGWTALGLAVANRDEILVDMLIKAGADVNRNLAISPYHCPPLYIAANKGLYNIVKSLLMAGANTNCTMQKPTSDSSETFLSIAATGDQLAKSIYDNGYDDIAKLIEQANLFKEFKLDKPLYKAMSTLKEISKNEAVSAEQKESASSAFQSLEIMTDKLLRYFQIYYSTSVHHDPLVKELMTSLSNAYLDFADNKQDSNVVEKFRLDVKSICLSAPNELITKIDEIMNLGMKSDFSSAKKRGKEALNASYALPSSMLFSRTDSCSSSKSEEELEANSSDEEKEVANKRPKR